MLHPDLLFALALAGWLFAFICGIGWLLTWWGRKEDVRFLQEELRETQRGAASVEGVLKRQINGAGMVPDPRGQPARKLW